MGQLRTVTRRIDEAPVRRSLWRILRDTTLCSISTVAAGNRAYINTAYFCVSPSLDLYFLSDAGSQHSRNLLRNPSMAVTVFDSSQEWGHPDRGVQMFGTGSAVEGSAAVEAERLYGERFPAYARWMRGRTALERRAADQLRTYRFYGFVPTRVKILDERAFGGGVFVAASVPRPRRRR